MASTIVVDKIQKTGGEAIQWPAADGAAGTVLRTTGSGVLEFAVDAGIASLAADTSPQLGGDLDCNGSQIQWSKGADVASATALVLLTDGNFFDVTGTVTVTSFNTTGGPGTQIKLQFDAACLLTHHATDLKLPGGANITTAAGDVAEFIEYAAGDYICTSYTKADGTAVVASNLTDTAITTADQSWTGSQRATLVVDNDGSFDMNLGQNFKCTPAGGLTLTFTNFTDGQSGFIILVNSGGHAIARHGDTIADATFVATVSAAGTYIISYISDGTDAFLTNSAIMA